MEILSMINHKMSLCEKLESVQYKAALAITGADWFQLDVAIRNSESIAI